MAEISFYQLSRDPIERVVPLLAAKVIDRGGSVLIVHEDHDRREALSDALWARGDTFLAHGDAGAPHAQRQPILLATDCEAVNGASAAIIADGVWRDGAARFDRVILLFGPEQTGNARQMWGTLSAAGHTLRIFKQGESGGWREGR